MLSRTFEPGRARWTTHMTLKMDRAGTVLALTLALGAAACADEPTMELEAARQSLDAAAVAGAREYAPETMETILALQVDLDTEMAAQGERFAPTRSYDHARALADSLRAMADAAAVEAGEARTRARQEAESLMNTLVEELAATRTALASAPRGKGSSADLTALGGDLDAVATVMEEARVAYSAEDYRGALTKLAAVRTGIDGVRRYLGGGTAPVGGTF